MKHASSRWIKRNRYLIGILLLAIIFRLILLSRNYGLWWDSHIYIGMGKYLSSNGASGIWEVFRPLGLPILLGSIWKANLPLLFMAKLLDLIFSTLAIYLVYEISHKAYNKTVALYATFIFATIPLFMLYTGLILTEPLTLVFALLALNLFIKRRGLNHPNIVLATSGICASLAFLTKFPAGVLLPSFLIAIFLRKGHRWPDIKTKIRDIFVFTISFIIPTIPFFIFNHRTYEHAFIPLTTGSGIINTFTWLYNSSALFYFTEFFLHNFVFLLVPIALICFLYYKEWRTETKSVIYITAILLFLYFWQSVARKEVRYMTLTLPFFSIIAASMLSYAYYSIKKQSHWGIRIGSFVVISILFIAASHLTSFEQLPATPQDGIMQDIVELYDENEFNGPIFISHPFLLAYLDNTVLPTTSDSTTAKKEYERLHGRFETIILRSCDFHCQENDTDCQGKKDSFLTQIRQENTLLFSRGYDTNQCQVTVFTAK